jgi:RNA polymerase sigma-70 factor, ECF subfamily
VEETDRQLVERTLAGDQSAFGVLVGRHMDQVSRLISEVMRSGSDVEDAVQECFLKTYRGLHTYRGDAQFNTWLMRIAYNVAITKSKRFARQRDVIQPDTEITDLAPDLDTAWADKNVNDREVEELMAARIDELPENYRLALTLYYYEEFTYQEIARVLDRPLNTIKAHISRAKASLKNLLVKDDAFQEWTGDEQSTG